MAIDVTTVSPGAAVLWAFSFSPDGAGRHIAGSDIDAVLATAGGWVWIHAGLADTRCRMWVERHAPISAAGREILLGADEHLQLNGTQGEVTGVLPDLQRELADASMDFARFRFVMTERMLITARRHPLHAIELTRRAIEGGAQFPAPMALLDGMVDQFVDAIEQLGEQLGDELDIVEERVLRDDLGDERQMIARVRLQVVRVRRQVSQLKTLFQRAEGRIAAHNPSLAIPVRMLFQKIDALDHDFGSIQERSRLLQDDVATKIAAVTNRRLFTLSILTACLLPPTLVTGIFGMNTKDLPLQQADGGTWYALAIAAASAGVAYWALRRLRAL